MPKYTNRQQLISTRTIADIAKQVHHEEEPKLIKRSYLFGQYDSNTNLWRDFAVPNDQITWNGRIFCCTDMRQVDNQTVPTQIVGNNPDTMRDETIQAAQDGANMVAPKVQLQTGRRTSNAIKVHGLSVTLRLRATRTANNDYCEHIKFKYGFYTWRKITATGHIDNATVPNINTLIKWKPQGYSSNLDNLQSVPGYQGIPYATQNLDMLMNSEKSTRLIQGETTMRFSNFNGIVNMKTVNLYKEFKDPIVIQYDPTSQTGREVLNQKIYFGIQSDLPQLQATDFLPRCYGIVKVYYTNIV